MITIDIYTETVAAKENLILAKYNMKFEDFYNDDGRDIFDFILPPYELVAKYFNKEDIEKFAKDLHQYHIFTDELYELVGEDL